MHAQAQRRLFGRVALLGHQLHRGDAKLLVVTSAVVFLLARVAHGTLLLKAVSPSVEAPTIRGEVHEGLRFWWVCFARGCCADCAERRTGSGRSGEWAKDGRAGVWEC